jgi:hypothetical protein
MAGYFMGFPIHCCHCYSRLISYPLAIDHVFFCLDPFSAVVRAGGTVNIRAKHQGYEAAAVAQMVRSKMLLFVGMLETDRFPHTFIR